MDRTVPRELYYSVQRRLNMMGLGAVWTPRSAVSGRVDPEELVDYCLARGIKVIATFDRNFRLPTRARGRIALVRLRGGRGSTVNKVIAALAGAARRLEGLEPSSSL